MKKKIRYILLIIIITGILYTGLRFAFGFFTPYNFLTAQSDIINNKIRIVELGELPLNYEQKNQLANQYGFSFHLHGCDVSSDIIRGAKYYNETIINHLEDKYGTGWWLQFQAKLDSIDNEEMFAEKPKTSIHIKYAEFETFYNKFISDTIFQLSRVAFPLRGQYQDYSGQDQWTKEGWPYMTWDLRNASSQEDSVSVIQTPDKFFYGTYCTGCGFSFEMEFRKQENQWLLVYRQENNF